VVACARPSEADGDWPGSLAEGSSSPPDAANCRRQTAAQVGLNLAEV